MSKTDYAGDMNFKARPSRVRTLRCAAALAAFCVVPIVLLFVAISVFFPIHDTTASASPDGRFHIAVRESSFQFIDRNFSVVLTDNETGSSATVFDSYDQSPAIESERFVWTADSNKVALVGDKYFVIENAKLPNGETLFLVCDLANDKLYCNSDQDRSYPKMSAHRADTLFDGRITASRGSD